ncbi:hypothetical protein Dvina_17680 [Dactylosporangium vinaceum]|uniref:Uncharacterized protein n=1 Tax=Dactylosporangium vinaceum TaxID=53362 RepID=A0ABV5M3B4_9ACTN|nr:hypothetical protein [Dactylosporangium vinaceum]UAB99728.1 hypothetical protein Dvina_17680 [Dactylosporangium vinaceum]
MSVSANDRTKSVAARGVLDEQYVALVAPAADPRELRGEAAAGVHDHDRGDLGCPASADHCEVQAEARFVQTPTGTHPPRAPQGRCVVPP